MSDIAAELRQRNRTVWAAGEWDDVSRLIAEVRPRLLDRVGVEEGMDVLDVATGSGGTVAIPAAERGARVVGSDFVPDHFDVGRRRAAEVGVAVEWVEADAEALPLETAASTASSPPSGTCSPRATIVPAPSWRACAVLGG